MPGPPPRPPAPAAAPLRADGAGLAPLLASRRVILCVGCGGVGKTTTTAALGLAAARRGKRVLCLTIDPARRLSQSLGLEEMKTEAQTIEPALFARAGLDVPGSMTVMMLDTKSTFDSLIESLAPSPEQRDRILGNVLYKYISTSLAGTQEYMAMEKLYAVRGDPSYDLILLDTPPTANALDFLDAPERLVGAIDSAATRWFVQAFQSSGKLSLSLLARSTAAVLRGIGKLTGSGFLEQVAGFISEMNAVFGSWKQRADAVAAALRGPDVAYVLVTTPDPLCVREVLYFAERLRDQQMRRDAFVVNRVHPVYGDLPGAAEIAAALDRTGLALAAGAAERLLQAAADESRMGKLDQLNLIALEAALEDEQSGGSLRADVPAFPYDIHDIAGLARIADVLAP
ncbi:ATPase [Sorangium cellulosum]|uniref:arsenite-transporting ATPase n=1 Tax=Sorangium cellulosum TaxID=56 RepID=A0A2L0F2F7_SORCE|nr:ArsA-related P-loop ATPase [Sorangium cellulosum]AUX45765.1 ATPase [Sorangium cellulosum]